MVAVNIPADGLFLAVQNKSAGDLSGENCTRIINEYIDSFLEGNPDIILLNVCYRRCLTHSEVFDSYLYNIETDENGYAVRDEKGNTVKKSTPLPKSNQNILMLLCRVQEHCIKKEPIFIR